MKAPRIRQDGGCSRGAGDIIGFILIITGIFFAPFLALIGLLVILIAHTQAKPTTICGACGNQVAPTSTLCPTCRASLFEQPIPFLRQLFILLWITALIAWMAYFIWQSQHQAP